MGHRAIGHGHAGERDNARRDHGPGLRRRDALHPDLLRTAAGDGHPLRDAGAVFLPRAGLHRLRVSGKALRRQDEEPYQFSLSCGKESLGCRRHLRPLGRARDRLWYRREDSDRRHRCRRHHLYRPRWHACGDVGRDLADDDHFPRYSVLSRLGRFRSSPRRVLPRRDSIRRRYRTNGDGRLQPRAGRDLYLLERHRRWNLPDALLFRVRPEPGAALPDGALSEPEPSVSPLQRPGEDPDAVRHPAHRDSSLRFLSVRKASGGLQPGSARATFGVVPQRRARQAAA